MKTFCRLATMFALAVFIGGCASSYVSSSPSSEPLMPGSYVEIGPARGNASVLRVLGIPLGSSDALDQKAMNEAIQKSGGDALVRISLKEKKCGLCLISTQSATVRATAVKKNE